MVVPALVGWWSHGPIDALGWANYILLGLKLGLGGLGVAYFFWTRERTDSEA